MKSVLISTRPKWCEKICHKIGKDENGKPIYEKRIEVRKSAPSEVPFKAYIYATKPKKFYKCGAMTTSDELLWLANGKVEMGDGFKFWADGDEYQCLNGKVIGEFICGKVMFLTPLGLRGFEMREEILKSICLTNDDLNAYGGLKTLYGWHISDLKIYDKPKELSEFISPSKAKKCVDYCINGICSNLGYEELCGAIRCCKYKKLTRPPQSWIYVEEQK